MAGRALKNEEEKNKGFQLIDESSKSLEVFLNKTKKPFICGNNVGMSDFMFWPFLQRIALRHRNLVKKNSTLNNYYERMLENDSVKACKMDDEIEQKFWIGYFNKAPTFDIGECVEWIN